jgi:hypothetical protein
MNLNALANRPTKSPVPQRVCVNVGDERVSLVSHDSNMGWPTSLPLAQNSSSFLLRSWRGGRVGPHAAMAPSPCPTCKRRSCTWSATLAAGVDATPWRGSSLNAATPNSPISSPRLPTVRGWRIPPAFMTIARRSSRRLFRATVRCGYANDRVAGRGANGNNPGPRRVCLLGALDSLPPSPSAPICPALRSCAGPFCGAASPCSPILRIDLRVARAATYELPAPLPPARFRPAPSGT